MSPRGIIGTGRSGYSLLHAFADNGHDAAVHLLLLKGADVDARDAPDGSGKTILFKAIYRGDEDFACRLLEAGASPCCTAPDGTTPLHVAAWKGLNKITAMLVERGADVNAATVGAWYGETSLHAALRSGNEEIAKLLLEKGADFTIKNRLEQTPLSLAQGKKFHTIVQMMQSLKPKRKWIF